MTDKISIQYCLLDSVSSVEVFLKETFQCSGSRLKKYFDKSFLNKSLKARAILNLPVDFVNDGEINPEYEGPAIEVIHEDENFLVMSKPHDLFVHPLSYSEKNNCLSFLRKLRPELLKVNINEYDRGLLYRLDFETSGVLIYVKSDEAYRFLRENFKSIAKKKIYHCLVEGKCELTGKYTHIFSSTEEKGRRVVVRDQGQGNEGAFILRPIEFLPKANVTLMEVELLQGLRHQIRAQLAHLGFPIRGDEFYGGKAAHRLYLNATNYEIEFQGRGFSFSSQPKDFNGL